MRVNSKIVIDLDTGAVVERDSYEYSGPVAGCISGSGGKTKSKSNQESGTKYNADFLRRATAFASGEQDTTDKDNFDTNAYLKAHPDVAADTNYGADPYQHYLDFGQHQEGYDYTPKAKMFDSPAYDPKYVKGAYTSVAPGGFDKLESSLYETQSSKLKQAYDSATAQQREELAQMGGLNSPSQYLEGSARSSLDRTYIQNLQQAARDAFMGRLGAETAEAARRTGFDVGEATRETGFNQDTAKAILEMWMRKIMAAIESGRYGEGASSGKGNTAAGGIVTFGPSNSSTGSTE